MNYFQQQVNSLLRSSTEVSGLSSRFDRGTFIDNDFYKLLNPNVTVDSTPGFKAWKFYQANETDHSRLSKVIFVNAETEYAIYAA